MTNKVLMIAAIALLFIPFPTVTCPEWQLRVVNENGAPLSNRMVDQACMNYTLGIDSCAASDSRQFSNADGFVRFPKRIIWAGLISRLVRSSFHLLMWPAEGSLGTKVRVYTSGPIGYPEVRYSPNEPMPELLVVQGGE